MKQNKGFIGIGLIIAIVLGIAVVGGGAYYLGKGGDKKEVKVEENNLPVVEEQNKTVVEEQGKDLPEVEKNDTPSIKVLSPNGGETFSTSTTIKQIPVIWKSSGITSKNVAFYIKNMSTGAEEPNGIYPDNGSTNIYGVPVGTYKIRICNTNQVSRNFEVTYDPDCSTASDYSDNSFTINSGTKDVSTIKESGDDINGKHIGFIKSIDSKNNLSIDYVQWVSPCTANVLTSYCMNGFEVVNDNTKLRSFPILDTAQIKLQTYSYDSSGGFNWNQVVSLPVFKNALNSNLLYWVTLKDGKVIEITEQYRP